MVGDHPLPHRDHIWMWNQVGLLVAARNGRLSIRIYLRWKNISNGRSMLSSSGKSGRGFVYCGDCEDQHRAVNGPGSRRKSWLKQKLTSLVKVELTNGWPYGFIVNHHYPLLTGCLIAQSKVDQLWVDDYRPSWLAITWPAVGWP